MGLGDQVGFWGGIWVHIVRKARVGFLYPDISVACDSTRPEGIWILDPGRQALPAWYVAQALKRLLYN